MSTSKQRNSQLQSDSTFDALSRTLSGQLNRRDFLKYFFFATVGTALSRLGIDNAWAAVPCLCKGLNYDPATSCCTPRGPVAKNPIANLDDCPKRQQKPAHTCIPNGCGAADGTKYPDGFGPVTWKSCCNNHDCCYDTCKSNRLGCDATLFGCVTATCSLQVLLNPSLVLMCLAVGEAYGGAVAGFGTGPYEAAQKKTCDCCGDEICAQSCPGGSCGALPPCEPGGDCVCFKSVEGQGACVHGNTPCAGAKPCSSTANCPPGYACLNTTCCGGGAVCGPICALTTPAPQSQQRAAILRVPSGPTMGGRR
jgi:hypothetical protein